ncbi:hypothetical protein ACM44_01190 [Chryseobacterium koreense CCUG 49689]|uniref:Uncharacterized protein n=1 Tax=Chryseobacterium koreense CCUG 49689 TaxID=1304281 RepID=A0A0J7J2V4_9FLAO|nr:hypothetical protein ACM44_01190 [Chryseobacterium koreense CCUG 49689]
MISCIALFDFDLKKVLRINNAKLTCYSSYRKCAKFDLQADLMKLSVEFFYKMMFSFLVYRILCLSKMSEASYLPAANRVKLKNITKFKKNFVWLCKNFLSK